MWKEGIIGIPTKDGEYKKVKYWVKHFDEPSEDYGINSGKIFQAQPEDGRRVDCQLRQRLGHQTNLQRSRNGALHSSERTQLTT